MHFEDWRPVIGLEIHARLNSQSKLFSPDPAGFSERENRHIHPVSMGLPGALPGLNKEALRMAGLCGPGFSWGDTTA